MALVGIPFIDNALGVGPAQEAARQQSQQNYAQGVNTQAAQLAQAQQLYQFMQMMQRYQQFVQQNPNPVNTWQGIQAPAQMQGMIGGGQIGASGNPAGGVMPQQNLAAMQQAMQARPPAQQAPVGGSMMMPGGSFFSPLISAQSPNGGVPRRYLESMLSGRPQ